MLVCKDKELIKNTISNYLDIKTNAKLFENAKADILDGEIIFSDKDIFSYYEDEVLQLADNKSECDELIEAFYPKKHGNFDKFISCFEYMVELLADEEDGIREEEGYTIKYSRDEIEEQQLIYHVESYPPVIRKAIYKAYCINYI